MDKRCAAGSLAFDGSPNEIQEPSRRFQSMSRSPTRIKSQHVSRKNLLPRRPPNNRLIDNVYQYPNDSYPINGEVCFNSARFTKTQEQFANDREANYFGESGDDVIENEQYQFEQERRNEDEQNYYPPSNKEIKNSQNHISFKTTRKSGSNQSRNEEYYRIVDNEAKNIDNFKEADNLFSKLSNDGLKDSGYFFIQRNNTNHEGEEHALNEPVCFGKSSCYLDLEDDKDQPEEKYAYNKTDNYAFAGPDEQFAAGHYSGQGARQPGYNQNTFGQQMCVPPSKSSDFRANEPLENARKESIYREVLNTINETVTELKNAGLGDESNMQESVANLDQIQRYRNYMEDKFGGIQLKGNTLNEGFMAGRSSPSRPQKNNERKSISQFDKRNEYRRVVINEPNLNTTSEPKMSPYLYRRFEENRSPMRQNASHEMVQKFQTPENKANEMYRRYCYYNMNDQCDKNFPENTHEQ